MSPHQILTVCIRLVALIWLLYTVSHLDSLFAYLNEGSRLQLDKTTVLIFASLQVATCAVFWLFPRSIAAKLLPGRDTDVPPSPSSTFEWQTLGVICVGIWALTRAIPDALYWATFFNMMAVSSNLGWSYFSPEQKAAMISTIAELGIGFWLVLGAKGFASILFKVRTAGINHGKSE
jgi:hypothetical protein